MAGVGPAPHAREVSRAAKLAVPATESARRLLKVLFISGSFRAAAPCSAIYPAYSKIDALLVFAWVGSSHPQITCTGCETGAKECWRLSIAPPSSPR